MTTIFIAALLLGAPTQAASQTTSTPLTTEYLAGEWTAKGDEAEACGTADSIIYHPSGELGIMSRLGTWKLVGSTLYSTLGEHRMVEQVRVIDENTHLSSSDAMDATLVRCPRSDRVVLRTR